MLDPKIPSQVTKIADKLSKILDGNNEVDMNKLGTALLFAVEKQQFCDKLYRVCLDASKLGSKEIAEKARFILQTLEKVRGEKTAGEAYHSPLWFNIIATHDNMLSAEDEAELSKIVKMKATLAPLSKAPDPVPAPAQPAARTPPILSQFHTNPPIANVLPPKAFTFTPLANQSEPPTPLKPAVISITEDDLLKAEESLKDKLKELNQPFSKVSIVKVVDKTEFANAEKSEYERVASNARKFGKNPEFNPPVAYYKAIVTSGNPPTQTTTYYSDLNISKMAAQSLSRDNYLKEIAKTAVLNDKLRQGQDTKYLTFNTAQEKAAFIQSAAQNGLRQSEDLNKKGGDFRDSNHPLAVEITPKIWEKVTQFQQEQKKSPRMG